jgi:hypothetical protein
VTQRPNPPLRPVPADVRKISREIVDSGGTPDYIAAASRPARVPPRPASVHRLFFDIVVMGKGSVGGGACIGVRAACLVASFSEDAK